ncbi:MAG: SDR family NAD(P)-dependent oxidoreductase [Gammaproteobacteria bacterium]
MQHKLTFVIYGAASDIVAPIFNYYKDADFICLVNKSKPDYLSGLILETGSSDFEDQFIQALSNISKDRMLVFISAAVYQKDELFIQHSQADISTMINVGISQLLFISQTVVNEMIKRRMGRAINLSSFRANSPTKGAAIYSAIKSFSNTFFSGLGIEYGRFDITSNSIAIGFAESKLLDNLKEEKINYFKQCIAKNKFLPNQEFLKVLDFIIRSKYFNASVIDLNGGLENLK